MRSKVRVLAGGALIIGLLLAESAASARTGTTTLVRQLRFKRGQTAALVRGVLKPGTKHVYKFRATAGQDARVRLFLAAGQKARPDDVLFAIQRVGDRLPGTNSQFLEGSYPQGNIDWSGKLPATSQYEIWVFNPAVSDHFINRALAYTLEVAIK